MLVQSSIDTRLVFEARKHAMSQENKLPTPFDKTLFLAIYTRIEPLNMSKTNFIDAVLTVMESCLKDSVGEING